MSDGTDVFDVLGCRNQDAGEISEALQTQDELREKSDDWSGEREVKRWRTESSSS